MKLVPAKCPNCGGTLEIDPNKEAAICQFCGCPFVVEKAIENYNINIDNSTHNHFDGATIYVQNDSKNRIRDYVEFANRALENKNYKDALNYAQNVLSLDMRNFDGWNVKVRAGIFEMSLDMSEVSEAIDNAAHFSSDPNAYYKDIFFSY